MKTDSPDGQTLTAPEIDWNWENTSYLAEWHEPIVELLSRYVPGNSKILEVGAGGSHTLGALASRLHCAAFGIEPDIAGARKTIELASRESSTVLMVRGDGFLLPFADENFDVVYSLGLIEHFSPKQSEARGKCNSRRSELAQSSAYVAQNVPRKRLRVRT